MIRIFCIRCIVSVLLMLAICGPAQAQHDSVVDTPHNLSASGPGAIRSTTERQVCKFCHVPHNAVSPDPMWGHSLSDAQYAVPEITVDTQSRGLAPQPDGSSRLCLSCHDGTVALGDIAGRQMPIQMSNPGALGKSRGSNLGTDLSGNHPISFKVKDVHDRRSDDASDFRYRSMQEIAGDREIKLDSQGKMQCTTCHDPHSDRHYRKGNVPRFWVKPTVDEVCLHCHSMS